MLQCQVIVTQSYQLDKPLALHPKQQHLTMIGNVRKVIGKVCKSIGYLSVSYQLSQVYTHVGKGEREMGKLRV